MREIKFRGKRIDNGEWVYGAFLPDATEPTHGDMVTWGFIRFYNKDLGKMETTEVDRETVGQYTGLKDKNGKDIYEGDKVDNGHTVTYMDKTTRRFANIGNVKYDVKNGCVVINNSNGYNARLTEKTIKENKIVVIGNIHEEVTE